MLFSIFKNILKFKNGYSSTWTLMITLFRKMAYYILLNLGEIPDILNLVKVRRQVNTSEKAKNRLFNAILSGFYV